MNRFHSSGTASGNVDRMCTWKMTMPITAMVPIVPPLVTSSSSGSVNSITVPMWAVSAPSREGRRSSGWSVYSRRLANLNRFHGVLLIITETTNGKWRLSLDDAAPHQMPTNVSWAATIRFSSGNRQTISSVPYTSLRAARNGTLSRRPSTPKKRQRHPHRHRLEPHGRTALARHQQVDAARPAAPRTAARPPACACCRRSAARARATAAGARCPAAASTGCRRSWARTGTSAASSRRPGPIDLPQHASRPPASGTRSARSTSRRSPRCRPAPAWWRRSRTIAPTT